MALIQWIIASGIALDMAHRVAPIILAWWHPGLRELASRNLRRSVLWPGLGLTMGIVIGIIGPRWSFVALAQTYMAWNIYHFGAQNFGLASLFHRTKTVDQRVYKAIGCIGGTAMLMPNVPFFGFTHWIPEILLTARVSQHPKMFLLILFLSGAAALWLSTGVVALQPRLGALFGMGFAHFLYDRWIWRLSDPRVRAIIGPRLGLTGF